MLYVPPREMDASGVEVIYWYHRAVQRLWVFCDQSGP